MPSILMLPRWYPPASGHFIRTTARAISRDNKVLVLVVEPDPAVRLFSFPVRFAVEEGDNFPTMRIACYRSGRRFPGAGMLNLLAYLAAQGLGMVRLRRMGLRFDLLHVHVLTRTAVIPFFRSIFTGKPYIISEYWTRYLPEASGYRGFLRKSATALVVRRATAASALSGYLREAMQRCGLQNKRFVVIPPAIDTELFSPSHPAVSDGKIRFLHISTFADEAKNVTGILRVVKRLAERRNDFECCLVGGEPPHVAPVLKLAGELGLAGTTVHYTGARFGADLAEEIRRSHFLVMFSNYETFSVVIQESLACGRPVVATSAGPLPALVGQESGILVTPGNEDELLDAIERMIGHVYEYDPAKLHDLVHRRFGLASVARAWTDTYRLF